MTAVRIAAVLLLGLTAAMRADACIWDEDTLAMERERFPSALELIAGKFLRHTPEFYRWRIEDRLARIKKEPDKLALLDDLAAAYDKTGQSGKAIEVMLASRARDARRYETEANLGTFYLHNAEYEKGVAVIGRALEINPDAHFGRERYQKLLAEYVAERQRSAQKKELLPLRRAHGHMTYGFASWLKLASHQPARVLRMVEDPSTKKWLEKDETPELKFTISPDAVAEPTDRTAALQAAVKGVLGMMKFGNFESPVLLEALGDLLVLNVGESPDPREFKINAGRLAARAYLKASMHVTQDESRNAYRALAAKAVTSHTDWSFDDLEKELKREIAEAQSWYAAIEANERAWIREARNPETEFAKLYYSEPAMSDAAVSGLPLQLVLLAAAALAAGLGYRWWRVRRLRQAVL